jgi:hypothetical protein
VSSDHGTESFDSGQLVLDDWLGAARFPINPRAKRLVDFYALAPGAII